MYGADIYWKSYKIQLSAVQQSTAQMLQSILKSTETECSVLLQTGLKLTDADTSLTLQLEAYDPNAQVTDCRQLHTHNYTCLEHLSLPCKSLLIKTLQNLGLS